jgi:hypothetical protein
VSDQAAKAVEYCWPANRRKSQLVRPPTYSRCSIRQARPRRIVSGSCGHRKNRDLKASRTRLRTQGICGGSSRISGLAPGRQKMKDPTMLLRSATRRAKSDVANKMISMFLHELSRKAGREWPLKVESEAYSNLVRNTFNNRCPYCRCDLTLSQSVVEHLDGMNRLRVGLHVPGNVLIVCRRCNGEKRRDDAMRFLTLAESGWESFLSHDSSRCPANCKSCAYWTSVWPSMEERKFRLQENLDTIREFRGQFEYFLAFRSIVAAALPALLANLYADCQSFAESEIRLLLDRFEALKSSLTV